MYLGSRQPLTEMSKRKGKGKVHSTTVHEDPEEEHRYNSTLSLTSDLDGVGDQRHSPIALPPGNTRCPLYRRLEGPHSRSGQVRKTSPSPGLVPRTVQSVASRYNDYTIPATTEMSTRNISWWGGGRGGLRRPVLRAENLTTFIYRLSRKLWSLNVLESPGRGQACIEIALFWLYENRKFVKRGH